MCSEYFLQSQLISCLTEIYIIYVFTIGILKNMLFTGVWVFS